MFGLAGTVSTPFDVTDAVHLFVSAELYVPGLRTRRKLRELVPLTSFVFFALSFAVFYIFRPSLASFALSFAVFWVIEWTLQMERALFVCQCLFSQP